MRRRLVLAAGVAALLIGLAPGARATPASVSKNFNFPVHAETDISSAVCDNTGSTIEVGSYLSFGGLSVQVTFKNNVQGTHTVVTTGTATLGVSVPGGLSIPKQPVVGGVGGNPWMSFEYTDASGVPLPGQKPVVLGRCVQGFQTHLSSDLAVPSTASAWVKALECSNKGTTISMTGYKSGAGIRGLLLLDNNINKVVHEAQAAAALRLDLTDIAPVSKGGNAGGAGGNPMIYLRFLGQDPQGHAYNITDDIYLDRCVKLG